jgi:hypothetical protein
MLGLFILWAPEQSNGHGQSEKAGRTVPMVFGPLKKYEQQVRRVFVLCLKQ